MKKTILLLALMGVAARADVIVNPGFESGSTSVTSTGGPSSLDSWNQWANSGPLSTQLSDTHVLEGASSAHITGGVNDGLYQYGSFSAGFYTASAWFWVGSGAGELGLFYNGGSTGAFSAPTKTTGAWEYVSTTGFMDGSYGGPVVYTAAPESDIYVDAFHLNLGRESDSPFDPSTGYAPNPSAVPEPGTLGLMGLGLLGLAAGIRRRK